MADQERVYVAAMDLAAILSPNWDLLDDTWRSLNCEEAEALMTLFVATGHDDLARGIYIAHRDTDEPGDLHYRA